MSLPRVIVGAGAQGRVTLEAWRAARPNGRFLFLDDDPAAQGREILGARVEGTLDRARELGGEVIVALGDNRTRLDVAARLGDVHFGVVVHPAAVISPSATLGRGTVVLAGALVGTEARVGEHVVLNTAVVLDHDGVVERGASLSPGTRCGGRVFVGEGAFVSTGTTLAPRMRVGAWSVVGAGSVVVRDVPERALAYGCPARVVGPIDASFDPRRLL